jgi:hypothetical protein
MRKMPTKVTSQISTSRKPRLKWFIAFTIPTSHLTSFATAFSTRQRICFQSPSHRIRLGVRVRDLSTIFNRDRCARHAIPIATEYIEAETGRQTGLLGFHAGLAAYHSDTRLRGSSALFQLITEESAIRRRVMSRPTNTHLKTWFLILKMARQHPS